MRKQRMLFQIWVKIYDYTLYILYTYVQCKIYFNDVPNASLNLLICFPPKQHDDINAAVTKYGSKFDPGLLSSKCL